MGFHDLAVKLKKNTLNFLNLPLAIGNSHLPPPPSSHWGGGAGGEKRQPSLRGRRPLVLARSLAALNLHLAGVKCTRDLAGQWTVKLARGPSPERTGPGRAVPRPPTGPARPKAGMGREVCTAAERCTIYKPLPLK